jgi:hypothetical protein
VVSTNFFENLPKKAKNVTRTLHATRATRNMDKKAIFDGAHDTWFSEKVFFDGTFGTLVSIWI